METRMELQRLLEDMDKMIRRKQLELSELDDRLQVARARVSESEAQELLKQQGDISHADQPTTAAPVAQRLRLDLEEALREQRQHYEHQIGKLTEELVELETSNGQLMKLNERLRADCDKSRLTCEQLKARAHLLSESLEEARAANFELNIRLAKAESESQMQQRLLRKSHEQDQLLMDAFNRKLESLREAIGARDLEIGRLRADNQLTLESLGIRLDVVDADADADADAANTANQNLSQPNQERPLEGLHAQTSDGLIDSSNKQRIIQIANLIRDRDAQIKLLKAQLMQVTCELESNTNLLQRLASERRGELKAQSGDTLMPFNGDDKLQSLAARCQMLDRELEVKDEQLNRIEWRNRQLELVMPVEVGQLVEKVKLALRRVDWSLERVDKPAEQLADGDEKNLKQLVADLSGQLADLLARFESAQTMLMAVEQQQLEIKNKDAQIGRLVRELNRLSAEINEDQIDLPHSGLETNGVQRLTQVNLDGSMKWSVVVEGGPDLESTRETSDHQQPTAASSKVHQHLESGAVESSEGQLEDNQQLDAAGNNNDSISLEQQQQQQQQAAHLASQSMAARQPASNMRKDWALASGGGQRRGRPRGRVVQKRSGRRKSNRHRLPSGSTKRVAGPSTRPIAKFAPKLGPQSEQPVSSSSAATATSVPGMGEGDQAAAGGGGGGGNESLDRRQLERALEFQDRLREAENENQLLELAMKEILLAIKWSDTRCSSLLIDCPSLERLCQLIEARFITSSSGELLASDSTVLSSGHFLNSSSAPDTGPSSEPPAGSQANQAGASNLFQFVVLKSELDLIRGQNEQLRSDLKLQRLECHERLLDAKVDCRLEALERAAADSVQQATEDDSDCGREDRRESFKFSEVEIQTDFSIQMNDVSGDNQLSERRGERCRKCARLIKLAHHLLDCFVRIESRVNANDETNIKRLIALYQLAQQLNQNLKSREQLIARHQRDLHSMAQQKVVSDSKLRRLESQLEVHSKLCSLTTMSHPLKLPNRERPIEHRHLQSSCNKQLPTNQMQIYTNANQKQSGERSISTFSMQDGRKRYATEEGVERTFSDNMATVQLKELGDSRKQQANKVTVALLQSIIACLQARLDYKDERLNQLEQMFAGEAAG